MTMTRSMNHDNATVKASLTLLLIASLLALMAVMPGCSKKECSVSSDCPQTSCFTGKCSDGACQRIAKPNCCGNAKCEAGAGENSCTCSDCGNCTGKGKIRYNVTSTTTSRSKVIETQFARYVCDDDDRCVVGVDPTAVRPQRFILKIDERGYFQAEVVASMNDPFVLGKDMVHVNVRLTGIDPKVIGSITFTRISAVLSEGGSEKEMGFKPGLSYTLSGINDEFGEDIDLGLYRPILVEEKKKPELKFEYSFVASEQGVENPKTATKRVPLGADITLIYSDAGEK